MDATQLMAPHRVDGCPDGAVAPAGCGRVACSMTSSGDVRHTCPRRPRCSQSDRGLLRSITACPWRSSRPYWSDSPPSQPLRKEAFRCPKSWPSKHNCAGRSRARCGHFRAEGPLSPYTCPECHGVLVQLQDGDFTRFRCHTGHAYSPSSILGGWPSSPPGIALAVTLGPVSGSRWC